MWSVLAIGTAGIGIGLAVAVALVSRDLGPFARLGRGQRVVLSAALSTGVIAFIFKMAIVAGLGAGGLYLMAPPKPQAPQAEPAAAGDGMWRDEAHYVWQSLPAVVPSPPGSPVTAAKVALGKRLFADPRLSRDASVSCATCHDVANGAGADAKPRAIGIGGQEGPRNSPTVFNAGYQALLFWDGRARSLEAQAAGPLLNPREMGNDSLDQVASRVAGDAVYRALFATAFGSSAAITGDTITKAIAAYERTLVSADSPYDRFVRGDDAALTQAQLRGMALFQQMRCVSCHFGPNFSRASLLTPEQGRSGLRAFPANASPAVAAFGLDQDRGAAGAGAARALWRVPSLRNVALTAPYFHNGAVRRLDDAVRIMAMTQLGRVVGDHPPEVPVIIWDKKNQTLQSRVPLAISEGEIADITAFLMALSGDALAARQAQATDRLPKREQAVISPRAH